MKTLLTTILLIITPFLGFTQGNTKVDISNVNITLLNKLLNKKIYNNNKVKNFTTASGVSVTDTVALSVGEIRVGRMLKTKKLSHILTNLYGTVRDSINPTSNITEVGENIMYSTKFSGKVFTYNNLVNEIFKGFMGSPNHKILIETSYSEKNIEVYISSFIKFKKNGSFYTSMIVTA